MLVGATGVTGVLDADWERMREMSCESILRGRPVYACGIEAEQDWQRASEETTTEPNFFQIESRGIHED